MVVGGPLSQNLTRARSKILCRTVYLNTICKIRELYRIYEYLRKKLRTSVNTRTKRAPYANPPTLAATELEGDSSRPSFYASPLGARTVLQTSTGQGSGCPGWEATSRTRVRRVCRSTRVSPVCEASCAPPGQRRWESGTALEETHGIRP